MEATIPGNGVYRLMLDDTAFGDMNGHWAKEIVEVLSARGVIDGIGGTSFAPDEAVDPGAVRQAARRIAGRSSRSG